MTAGERGAVTMSGDRAAMLAGLRVDHRLVARLAYADWLDDFGVGDRDAGLSALIRGWVTDCQSRLGRGGRRLLWPGLAHFGPRDLRVSVGWLDDAEAAAVEAVARAWRAGADGPRAADSLCVMLVAAAAVPPYFPDYPHIAAEARRAVERPRRTPPGRHDIGPFWFTPAGRADPDWSCPGAGVWRPRHLPGTYRTWAEAVLASLPAAAPRARLAVRFPPAAR